MNGLTGRRIALIGGAGFVGHHLAMGLKALRAEPVVIDSLGVNNYYSLQTQQHQLPGATRYLEITAQRMDLLRRAGIPLHVEDARDYHSLSQLLGHLDVDSIVHLAAVAHAGRSNKDPMSTFDHSLRTLENALDNARSPACRIEHFIYLSSSMVYGNFDGASVTEESPCQPIGIYGALKFAGEKLVIAYNQVFDLPYTIIRPSALYGERCISRRVGQVFIENAIDDKPLIVHGTGTETLDFTYIEDLIDGIVRVLSCDNARNEIFNMTYGAARPIADLVDILRRRFANLQVVTGPQDHLMPARGTLSVDKAARLLGYEPQYPLEIGFNRYIDWYRTFLERPQPMEYATA